MDKTIIKLSIIKIAYIVGIILDGLLGIDMILYSFFGTSIFLQTQKIPISNSNTQPVMMMGTALMVGWTILLLWGLLKPIERKDILIITAFPVVFLYIIYDVFYYIINYATITIISIMPVLIVRLCLMILMSTAYFLAKKYDTSK